MKVAIIGTAGRRDDAQKLSGQTFQNMVEAAADLINRLIEEKGVEELTLISGGAAWADHVAVKLMLKPEGLKIKPKLRLHMPCHFRTKPYPGFLDTKVRDFRKNPGGIANYYHEKFANQLYASRYATLREIAKAAEAGAELVEKAFGMMERNSQVAKEADTLLAITFGENGRVKDGGTADTVKKFFAKGKTEAYHHDLNCGQTFPALCP
jgi:hypothetical protein